MGNSRIDELNELDNKGDEGSASEPEPEPEPDESEEQDAAPETEVEPDEQPSEDADSEPMSTSTEDESNDEAESESTPVEESKPAYSGDDFDRETLYCLQETSERYKDAMDRYDVLVMRNEIGLRNVTQRERQEAMMRMAADHPEVIAEYIVEMRGLDVDVPDSP
ncbi:hypothetical protein [Halococcus sp. PRR34]|uniref:Uncharacterized protein n=2 Tax=Halococcus saccharolyticus TaxID=62319 RepID=M0ME37_9EURY|nr:hypothetical protein [Halococcus sp. PRR34]EMA43583.1 hypothetical protein C449_13527 [Halococcus saccharolyticus DSM 5350]